MREMASGRGVGAARGRKPTPSDLRKLHERMRRERDHGEAIFAGLSPKTQRAYARAQRIERFKRGRVVVRRADRPSNRQAVGGDVSTQARQCYEALVTTRAFTLIGNVAYDWTLHKFFCTIDNGTIDGEPEWWVSLDNVDPLFVDHGVTSSRHFWQNRPTQHYTWAQSRIENCIFKYGCGPNTYPQGEIQVDGFGRAEGRAWLT
jgi:hypothetical protein